ncbi:MAG: glycoside hydrolase family 10 protein [Methanopyraceae archaeon]
MRSLPAHLALVTLLLTPAAATEVGVFAWGSTVRSVGVENFVTDVIDSGYTKVAVLIRGVSTPTRVDTLQQVYHATKARAPNVKVYAWVVGFERRSGWDRPWDPEVQQEILDAVTAALPYCDGVVLDDSFRYPTRDPEKRRLATQAITDLVRRISELVHAQGKELYFCLLPENPRPYSIDRDAIAQYVDRFIVEAYTYEYGRDDWWPVHVYHLYQSLYPGKVAIALHEPRLGRLLHQIELLKEAGCPEVWIFRYGEVRGKLRLAGGRAVGTGGSPETTGPAVTESTIDLTGLLEAAAIVGAAGAAAFIAATNPDLLRELAVTAADLLRSALDAGARLLARLLSSPELARVAGVFGVCAVTALTLGLVLG